VPSAPTSVGGVRLHDVVVVLDALRAAEVPHWVAGGWGVDCLVGRQSRAHRDLDLAVDAASFDCCIDVLSRLGYAPETDWLPLRLELRASGERWVDLHPVSFDAEGYGLQGAPEATHFTYPPEAFNVGCIDDYETPCLSAEQQRRFHSGYELRPHDRHDMALLDALSG